ncbi:MAG: adenylyl-sulfate reductase subunit alpha [Deltaproteobacteria bacterium]|nr:adenylyl-sulfate reductase subunit alpha [Deltaproteobacteria bacterium]
MAAFKLETRRIKCDVLVVGAGAAGCVAGALLGGGNLKVVVAEKAAADRSGCLAAGVNAVNAHVGEGRSPADYRDYAIRDAHGVASPDLLLSMSERLNWAAERLASLGAKFHRNPDGSFKTRSWRNLKVNGENIKPLLAAPLKKLSNVLLLERLHVTNLALARDSAGSRPRAVGAFGFFTDGGGGAAAIEAGAVIVATGGAAGIYLPNNPGQSRHKMWYPPFNTGGGLAFGVLAGAEMTTLEMRFVALRCRDTAAPTGTLALGAGAAQVNALGESYEEAYGNSTSQRVLACRRENAQGRGPCHLFAPEAKERERLECARAYFHMAPLQALRFLEEGGAFRKGAPLSGDRAGEDGIRVLVEGTEPYVIGGHTASGYKISTLRETSLSGLFAAGDVAGGAPQKYVSGSMAEGALAAAGAEKYLKDDDYLTNFGDHVFTDRISEHYAPHLSGSPPGYTTDELEEAMQKSMDSFAGGRSTDYRYSRAGLRMAGGKIRELYALSRDLKAGNPGELSRIFELKERLVVSLSLIAHLLNRKETRWPGFGEYADHPERDPRYDLFVNSVSSAYGGRYPEALESPAVLARDLSSGEEIPLPEPAEDVFLKEPAP